MGRARLPERFYVADGGPVPHRPLLEGYDGSEGAVGQAEQPKLKIEDLCYWSVKAQGAVEHVYPGALVEIPVGKGRLIVDQIRWETDARSSTG